MNWVGGEGANLIFRQTSPSDSLIYLSIYHIPVKTWLRVYLVIISALKLKVNKQKNPFVIQYQKLDFFQNSSVPFHRATFGYSISCVVLRDRPNESCQNSKKFGRNAISTTKKVLFFLKKKGKQYYTSKGKCPNFTNFFRTPETNQRKIYPSWGLFWCSSKNIFNLLSIMLHITPWTLMLMLHIRQSTYLVLTNVLSTSFLMFHITFDEISTTLSAQFW